MNATIRIVVDHGSRLCVYEPTESERRGFIPTGRRLATLTPAADGDGFTVTGPAVTSIHPSYPQALCAALALARHHDHDRGEPPRPEEGGT